MAKADPRIEEMKKQEEEKRKAIYACMVCKSMFKKPGMCPGCDQMLKKKAG